MTLLHFAQYKVYIYVAIDWFIDWSVNSLIDLLINWLIDYAVCVMHVYCTI